MSAQARNDSRDRVLALRSWHHDWAGLRVAVLGLGVTGFSVADTLVELGSRVRVFYRDEDPPREQLLEVIGAERARVAEDTAGAAESSVSAQMLAEFAAFDPELVVVSPGYRPDHPFTVWADAHGITVWGDIELGWRLRDKTNRVADWICVTGTNGKTTTAQLTAQMLLAGGFRAAPVGNIGVPLLDALRDPQGYDVLVVELSSFQLHRLHSGSEVAPYASVCLNVADDHLDWHGSRAAYRAAKSLVYQRTQVACVYNRADAVTEHMVRQAEVVEGARAISFGLDSPPASGFGVVEGILVDRGYHANRQQEAYELLNMPELAARGLAAPHQVQNVLAAAALARAKKVKPAEVARAVLEFQLDPHRMQHLGVSQGVAWIDDSKATNAHAANAALSGMKNVVWVFGGLFKGTDIGALVAAHAGRLRGAVVIGAERQAALAALQRHAPTVPALEVQAMHPGNVMTEAVAAAMALAQRGDTVLLSPAAASMDQFDDYADRGRSFQRAVRALGNEQDAAPEQAVGGEAGDDDSAAALPRE